MRTFGLWKLNILNLSGSALIRKFVLAPRIDGTRMPVSSILEYLSSGMSIKELIKDFPFLTEEDVLEALAFSARMMQDKYLNLEQAS